MFAQNANFSTKLCMVSPFHINFHILRTFLLFLFNNMEVGNKLIRHVVLATTMHACSFGAFFMI